MENASKALIMAAGVLIGLLIISLAVYLFADFGATSAQINQQVEQKRILQFNSQFTSYIGKELTIYDVVTILGYAQENNNYYENGNGETIEVKIENSEITNYNEQQKNNLISNNSNINNGNLPKYKLEEGNISYNNNGGKVSSITFTK